MEEKNLHRFPDNAVEENESLPRQETGGGEETLGTEEILETGAGTESLNVERLQQTVAALAGEKETVENRLLRLQADFDNFRRRVRAEKEETITLANFNLVQKLLAVIDNLERALSALQEGPASIREGLEMIKKHFLEILFSEGVSPIQCVGEAFDPFFHEAVLREENSAYPPGTVVEELQKGYIMHERVLRASKVKVSVE